MKMNKTITPFPAPGIVNLIQLTGELEGWHFCAKTKIWKKVFSNRNTIQTELKAIIRDNMNSPTDFAMDNLFSVDGEVYGGDATYGEPADPAGKDGIMIYDDTNNLWLTMVTVVHPTDPSGSYYRQWQGVLTNDFGIGSFVIDEDNTVNGGAAIGTNLNASTDFLYEYAIGVPAETTMAGNDILTVNWKIAVG